MHKQVFFFSVANRHCVCVSYNFLNKKFNLVIVFSYMNNRNNVDLER